MKKLVIIFISVVLCVLLLSVFKDLIVKISVEKGVALVTGLKLRIQSFEIGVVKTLIGIKDLKLFNPPGFKDRVMLDMPEIYVNYDLPAIIKGNIHLREMRLNMKEFTVVKNEKGLLNLDSLKVVKIEKENKKRKANDGDKILPIQIDSLELKIGKVIYKDYSRGPLPYVKEFNLNVDERYENIRDAYTLVSLVVVRALRNTTIANLADFDLGGLQNTILSTLQTAQKVVTETATGAQEVAAEAVKQTTELTDETVKGTQETVNSVEESVKDLFKSPFGSKEE